MMYYKFETKLRYVERLSVWVRGYNFILSVKKDCLRIAREKARILTFFQNLTLSFLDLDLLLFPEQEKPQVLQVSSLPNLF